MDLLHSVLERVEKHKTPSPSETTADTISDILDNFSTLAGQIKVLSWKDRGLLKTVSLGELSTSEEAFSRMKSSVYTAESAYYAFMYLSLAHPVVEDKAKKLYRTVSSTIA